MTHCVLYLCVVFSFWSCDRKPHCCWCEEGGDANDVSNQGFKLESSLFCVKESDDREVIPAMC